MAPILTRVAFHSSIIHPPHHTWLWIVVVFFYSPSRNKVWKLSTVDNIPKKKKKRRLRKRFRRNSKHGNTSERWQHWSHDPAMKSQTAYRPGAGEGFPNTQRGALQRGGGALLWPKPAPKNLAWPAVRPQLRSAGWALMPWLEAAQPLNWYDQDVCWQKLWFELLVQPVTLPNVKC